MGKIRNLKTSDGTESIYPKTVTNAVYDTIGGNATTQKQINEDVQTSLSGKLSGPVVIDGTTTGIYGLSLVSGDGIEITADDDEVTIAADLPDATQSAAGLMSATDKAKLDNLTLDAASIDFDDTNAQLQADDVQAAIEQTLKTTLGAVTLVALGYDVYERGATLPLDQEGLRYALQMDRTASGNCYQKYYNDTSLVYMPKVDFSGVTRLDRAFKDCSNLQTVQPTFDISGLTVKNLSYLFDGTKLKKAPAMDTAGITTMSYMFQSTDIETAPDYDMDDVIYANSMFKGCAKLRGTVDYDLPAYTTVQGMFYYCGNVEEIYLRNTANASDFRYLVSGCASLRRLEVDWSAIMNGNTGNNAFNQCSSLRYMKIANLGKSPEITTYSCFSNSQTCPNWGDDTTRVPDALDSLKWTFNNLYDRAGDNLDSCTISLYRTIYDRLMGALTTAEITAITNKGYTITRI